MLWRTGLCEPMVLFGSKTPYILLYISTYFSFLWGGVGGGTGAGGVQIRRILYLIQTL